MSRSKNDRAPSRSSRWCHGRRAGKSGAHVYYHGYTFGSGGPRCPCCGAEHPKTIRRKAKQRIKQILGDHE